jgi:hypothetical protein
MSTELVELFPAASVEMPKRLPYRLRAFLLRASSTHAIDDSSPLRGSVPAGGLGEGLVEHAFTGIAHALPKHEREEE